MTSNLPDPLAVLFDPIHRPVLDAHDGLERVAGDRPLFARMLERFWHEYRHALEELQSCLARQDHDGAHLIAHTLKGAAGVIGAGGVSAAAALVDTVLRTSEGGLDEALAQLETATQDLMALLARAQAAVPAASMPGSTVRPLGDGAQLLRELDTLLDNGDGAAVDLVDQAGPALAALLGAARYAQLAGAVHGFDFDAARAALADPPPADGADTAVSGG
ncbi:phosphotransfer domain-containing protein [Massilia arenosa]|uniref:Phosphotransfer domain-containing protein n=1 Tax=Zemynaea arenosa TaxID=2561931 RepID=A0A4Y9SLL0_9BURK|nr:Hpt domain-containing protein [Massilia arenosa]TFW22600.1 phosphotransfer domain-containing protein [Massilia arenosa]